MPNIVNRMNLRVLEEDFEGAAGLVMVTFGGLDVATTAKIRNEIAAKGAKFKMVRNKLARRALLDKGLDLPQTAFKGNVAVAYGDAEAVIGAAKALSEPDVKKTKKVAFVGGALEGQALNGDSAALLADLPDKNTMRAMLLGVISAPARGIACVLNGVPSATVRVVQARADAGGFGGAPAAE